jgi:hypothetical protein
VILVGGPDDGTEMVDPGGHVVHRLHRHPGYLQRMARAVYEFDKADMLPSSHISEIDAAEYEVAPGRLRAHYRGMRNI